MINLYKKNNYIQNIKLIFIYTTFATTYSNFFFVFVEIYNNKYLEKFEVVQIDDSYENLDRKVSNTIEK